VKQTVHMNNYIVASSKAWHLDAFERFRLDMPGRWVYVESRCELEKAVVEFAPRYIFLLHWNWVVPQAIWSKHECICFHMTDVPYGRGGSPLQNLILAGRVETEVTALRMIDEMDAGPVYAKRAMSLSGRAEEIYLRAGELCWEMIRWMLKEAPIPTPQKGEVTKFMRRKPEQSLLPMKWDLTGLYDHIRMLDAPTYPLAFIDYGDYRMEFTHAGLGKDELRAEVTIKKRQADKSRGK
jgi:methionyl-tRNA formyltransferase